MAIKELSKAVYENENGKKFIRTAGEVPLGYKEDSGGIYSDQNGQNKIMLVSGGGTGLMPIAFEKFKRPGNDNPLPTVETFINFQANYVVGTDDPDDKITAQSDGVIFNDDGIGKFILNSEAANTTGQSSTLIFRIYIDAILKETINFTNLGNGSTSNIAINEMYRVLMGQKLRVSVQSTGENKVEVETNATVEYIAVKVDPFATADTSLSLPLLETTSQNKDNQSEANIENVEEHAVFRTDITNLKTKTQEQDIKIQDNTDALVTKLNIDGTNSMTADLNAGTNKIVNVVNGVNPQDVVTKSQLDLKQNITDNTLNTTNKTIPGGINELESRVDTLEANPSGGGIVRYGTFTASSYHYGILSQSCQYTDFSDGTRLMKGNLFVNMTLGTNVGNIFGASIMSIALPSLSPALIISSGSSEKTVWHVTLANDVGKQI